MCVWWRTYLLHIWIRETEETAAIMTPLYLFFFSRLLRHISDQMRSYNWLYGRSPSWSNVSVYRLMSPYCQRSRYRNKSDQVIIYCWFNTGEVFTDRGSGLSHYSPAEEIMTCRCSAVAAKLVFLFFSFLFFLLLYSEAAVFSSSHPSSCRPTVSSPTLLHHWKCFLSGTYEPFLTFILSQLLFWRNLVIVIITGRL